MDNIIKRKMLKDVTITHVSYVKRGANRKTFFLAKSADQMSFELAVRFLEKADDEKRLLYGIVYEPDIEDSQGDFMTADEIEKCAHEFMEYYRNIDTEHNLEAGAGVAVESYIAPVDLSIGNETIKSGSWILVTRASQDVWDDFKAGEITGYSMFGISRNTKTTKGEPKLKTWFKKLFGVDEVNKDFGETMENAFDEMSRNPWFIMDIMQTDYFNSIDWNSVPEEQLGALSEAMKSAAQYIDEKIGSLSKSEPEPEAEPQEPAQPEPKPEEPEVNSEQDGEQEKPEEPEPDDAVTKSVDKLAGIIADQNKTVIDELTKAFDAKIESLTEKLEKASDKIKTLETQSSLTTETKPIVKRSTPGINIL